MKRERVIMFGAITALTLSLVWAASLMPGGMPGIPGLLSIGSLVQTSNGPVNFDTPRETRCDYDVRAELMKEEARSVRERTRNIRIEVEQVRQSAKRHRIIVQRKHQHRHEHKHNRSHERQRCRSRITRTQPTMPIPPIPPIPPVPPLAPMAPMAPMAPLAPTAPLPPTGS